MKLHSYLKKNRLGIFYYRIQWRDESGKRRETCASLHTRDPDEARALSYMAKHEIAALEAILAGMQPKPEIVAMIEREKQDIDKAIQDQSLTLQEAIDQFLLVEKGGLAASTKKAYKTRMEMLTKHVGPKRGLGFIRKPDVVKALEASTLTAPHESKRHTATEGRLNHTTIKNALTLWIEFFDWCIQTDRYIHDNPASGLKPPAQAATRTGGADGFDEDELKKIPATTSRTSTMPCSLAIMEEWSATTTPMTVITAMFLALWNQWTS